MFSISVTAIVLSIAVIASALLFGYLNKKRDDFGKLRTVIFIFMLIAIALDTLVLVNLILLYDLSLTDVGPFSWILVGFLENIVALYVAVFAVIYFLASIIIYLMTGDKRYRREPSIIKIPKKK